MYRCAACEDCRDTDGNDIPGCTRYYRRAGLCVKCPDQAILLIVGFIVGVIALCCVAYMLSKWKVNLAFGAIAIDYFQVLAIFANSRVQWPAPIVELLHILSAFNFSIDITAPECTIPDLGYIMKWTIIEVLPVAAMSGFVLFHLTMLLYKKVILGRKKKLMTHAGGLVGAAITLMYALYLSLTKTTLDMFNCAPTNPPDGNTYLEVVFEECGKPGGIQMTLLPFAIITFVAYTLGYPAFLAYNLVKHRHLVMEDQLLRAKGLGEDRLTNPHAYDVRKAYNRAYQFFKPDRWYWIFIILGRKFLIAFTSLMFSRNPAFQLSMALLVVFVSFALTMKYTPYMSSKEHEEVLGEHRRQALEGHVVHRMLATQIASSAIATFNHFFQG
jgi:hypothetical protein